MEGGQGRKGIRKLKILGKFGKKEWEKGCIGWRLLAMFEIWKKYNSANCKNKTHAGQSKN